MVDYDKVLWLIPARSGSKSIPNKNIIPFNGKPLIANTIELILGIVKKNENVWVSTDSKSYATIAEKYGAMVPFLRPEKLSSDNSSSMDVILHAMDYATKNLDRSFDFIGLLECTSPFMDQSSIIGAFEELFNNSKADSIVSVKELKLDYFFIQRDSNYLDKISTKVKNQLLNKGTINRQSFKPLITPGGGIYISRWDRFIQNKSFYSKKCMKYKVSEMQGFELDELHDLELMKILNEGIINSKNE